MSARQHIEEAIRAEGLPDWVERVTVNDKLDADGVPALDVLIVVREGHPEVFRDGAKITEVERAVSRAVDKVAPQLWPYTRYTSADELDAA